MDSAKAEKPIAGTDTKPMAVRQFRKGGAVSGAIPELTSVRTDFGPAANPTTVMHTA